MMAEFDYQGIDRSGKRVSGTLSANGDGELRMLLRQQGVRPTRITRSGGGTSITLSGILSGGGGGGNKNLSLTLKDKILLTRQLQVLVSSGIPLVQGLDILAEQTVSGPIREMLNDVKERVNQGSFFWESISAYPRSFSKIYIAMIRSGETSGSLDLVLKRLSRYLEDADRVRKMVIGSLIYPFIILCVGLLVMAGMMIFVVPKLKDMLSSNHAELPLPTQIVVGISDFMQRNLLQVSAGAALGVFLLVRFFRTSEGKAVGDRILYALPLFGGLVQKAAIAGFSRTLQTLSNSGVNLIDAVDIARTTVDNVVVADAVAKIRPEIEMGKTLGNVIGALPVFPRMAVQMISVGEATGNLDKMLEKVADFYEAEVEAAVSAIGKLVEPLLLVCLGGAIAGMLLAMYLPLFSMASGVGG